MQVNKLVKDELIYELAIRGVKDEGTVEEMRKRLRILTKYEANGTLTGYGRTLNMEEELKACDEKLKTIRTSIESVENFENGRTNADYRHYDLRLTHTLSRLERVESDKKEIMTKRSQLLGEVLKLMELLEEKVNDPVEDEKEDDEDLLADMIESTRIKSINSTASAPAAFKPVPVAKWGITFTGELNGSSVNAFLERIEEIREARHTSKEELWVSSIDLFEGPALIWFRSVRSTLNSWDELVEALRLDFQSPSYEEDLWTEIRQRTQGPTERVGIYIATMENLFSRLPTQPSEREKLAILRKNISPYFIDRLALQEISSINDLKRLCRQLDAAKVSCERFQPPRNESRSVEPDLAYRKQRSYVAVMEHRESPLRCWNCQKAGHFSRQCPNRKIPAFCSSCGNKNDELGRCGVCQIQGNDKRGLGTSQQSQVSH